LAKAARSANDLTEDSDVEVTPPTLTLGPLLGPPDSGEADRASPLCDDEETGDGGPISEMDESESRLSAPGLSGPLVGEPGDARPRSSSSGLLADSGLLDDPDE
jgi:hypothetical protein